MKSEELTFEHDWKKGDLLFINNRRFLHGRTKNQQFKQTNYKYTKFRNKFLVRIKI